MGEQEKLDKDLKEIIDVVADVYVVGKEKLLDGFQYTDLFALTPVLMKIPEAITDAGNALHYLKGMNEEREEAVIAAVTAKLGDTSDETKEGVRRVLRLLAELYMTAVFFRKDKVTA